MHERPEDRQRMVAVLNESYARAGSHLSGIHETRWRMSVDEIIALLQGMCLSILATASSDGRPFASPVDAYFVRGDFYFSSSRESLRARHIARQPCVSLVHAPRTEEAVTVHGRASEVDPLKAADGLVASAIASVYGEGWTEWGADNPMWRIDADRMFTFKLRQELLSE